MTNSIYLHGTINSIEFSHESNGKRYLKAIIVATNNLGEHRIPIKFREDKLTVKDGDYISVIGNLRTYNKKIYIYTNLENVDFEDAVPDNCDTTFCGQCVKKEEKFKSYIFKVGDNTFVPVKSDKDYEIGSEYTINGFLTQRFYRRKINPSEELSTLEVIER